MCGTDRRCSRPNPTSRHLATPTPDLARSPRTSPAPSAPPLPLQIGTARVPLAALLRKATEKIGPALDGVIFAVKDFQTTDVGAVTSVDLLIAKAAMLVAAARVTATVRVLRFAA